VKESDEDVVSYREEDGTISFYTKYDGPESPDWTAAQADNEGGGQMNVFDCDETSDGYQIAQGLYAVARAITALGTNGASSPMGAIELLAKELRDGFDRLADAIRDVKP
jgi:hypothetical protein